METKHTKGPWHWAVSPQMVKAYIGANKTHYIAEVLTHEWKFEETEANARLIASAPDMLEVLEKLKKILDEQRKLNYMGELIAREFPELDNLINKANNV